MAIVKDNKNDIFIRKMNKNVDRSHNRQFFDRTLETDLPWPTFIWLERVFKSSDKSEPVQTVCTGENIIPYQYDNYIKKYVTQLQ